MNNNGFTKRNVFIGDVQITEDLTCGDMVCQEMTLTGDINLDNKDIVGVNNLDVTTINGLVPGTGNFNNPATSDLDMKQFSILNNPEIKNLEDKTQYITVVPEFSETQFNGPVLMNGAISTVTDILFANGSSITTNTQDLTLNSQLNIATDSNINSTASITCQTLNATSINVPAITTLETKTQYQSTSVGSTNFTGIVNPSLTLSIGNSQPNQVGYSLPTSRPLTAGYVMVTPNATGNTLQFVVPADPNKIQYLTASGNVSTFTGNLIVTGSTSTASLSIAPAPNNYSMPIVRGLTTQYLGSDGVNAVWKTFASPTYSQIARQGALETVGYTMVADVLRSATNLGGTVNASFLSSSDITVSIPNGTLTYTGLQRVLSIECSCRARIGDAKQANDFVSLYLTINGTTVSLDTNQVNDITTRTWLYCKYIQPVNTNSVISFSISYGKAVTTNLFLSGISLSVNAYSF